MATASPLLLSSLSKYFNEHPEEALMLRPLVDGTYPVSLRVIDWCVTHYSKLRNVLYWVDDKKQTLTETVPQTYQPHIRKIHLYYEYRAQLKSYTKLFFDPFRRHDRISFIVQTKPLQTIETTAGQLNFFRWAIQIRLLDYIQRHLSDIEEAMTQYQCERKKKADTTAPAEEKKPIARRGKKKVQTIMPVSGVGVEGREYKVRFD
jgi:hypothetical protein